MYTKKHKTLKERILEYEGEYSPSEWDTGKSVGKEVVVDILIGFVEIESD